MRIEANEGCVFALKNRTAVYGNIMYLGIYDSEDNYIQLTIEEAEELRKELEAAAMEETPTKEV